MLPALLTHFHFPWGCGLEIATLRVSDDKNVPYFSLFLQTGGDDEWTSVSRDSSYKPSFKSQGGSSDNLRPNQQSWGKKAGMLEDREDREE